MARAPLLLLLLAVVGVGWFLKDTLLDTDAGDAEAEAVVDTDIEGLAGAEAPDDESTAGPSLATSGARPPSE